MYMCGPSACLEDWIIMILIIVILLSLLILISLLLSSLLFLLLLLILMISLPARCSGSLPSNPHTVAIHAPRREKNNNKTNKLRYTMLYYHIILYYSISYDISWVHRPRPRGWEGQAGPISERGMIRLETLVELKLLDSSSSILSSYRD